MRSCRFSLIVTDIAYRGWELLALPHVQLKRFVCQPDVMVQEMQRFFRFPAVANETANVSFPIHEPAHFSFSIDLIELPFFFPAGKAAEPCRLTHEWAMV